MMEFLFLRLLCLLQRPFWSSSWRKNLAGWLCTHYVLDLDDLVLRQCQWSAGSVRWNCLFARILKHIVGSEWTGSCCWEHVSSLVSRAELLHLVLSTATLEVIRGFCDFYTIFHCIASLIVGVAARSSRHRRRGKGGYWSSLLLVLFGPSCVFLLQVQFALLRFICQSETRPLIIYPELKRMTIFWVQTCILKVVIVTSEDHFLLFKGF